MTHNGDERRRREQREAKQQLPSRQVADVSSGCILSAHSQIQTERKADLFLTRWGSPGNKRSASRVLEEATPHDVSRESC
jgi:hypothetical protein